MPARRTSNAMKVLRGTDRPDRMRDEAGFSEVDSAVDAPDWLNGPEAVKEWDARVDDLVEAGVLTHAALSPLGHYCNLHGAIVRKWLAGMEPTAAEITQFRLMATEFGFTPASRTKAGGGKKKDAPNPFARLAKDKAG